MKNVMVEKSNERALKIIEQQYDDFINQTNSWNFFRGLASYIKTTQELLQTQPFIDALEQQRKVARMVYEQTNTQAFKEMMMSAEKVVEITKDLTKKLKPVAITINKVQDQLKGNLLSSSPLNTLNHSLFDIAIVLKQSGYADIIKQFEDNNRKRENIFGDYTFSPTYEKLAEEKEKLERKEQVEPWGAWQGLPLVKKIVFEPDELAKELKKETNPDKRWAIINLFGVMGELEQIRSGQISDDDVVFFKIEHYRDYARRVQQYLLKELLQSDDKPNIDSNTMKFDVKKNIQKDVEIQTQQEYAKKTIPIHQIIYNGTTRKITLNGRLLAKPDFDSENERFFTLIYAHPNKRFSKPEIEKETGKLKKGFHQIIRDLGFKNNLKVFFGVSKTSIQFNNPIPEDILTETEILAIESHQKNRNNEK